MKITISMLFVLSIIFSGSANKGKGDWWFTKKARKSSVKSAYKAGLTDTLIKTSSATMFLFKTKKMIPRLQYKTIKQKIGTNKLLLLSGPREVGKQTIVKEILDSVESGSSKVLNGLGVFSKDGSGDIVFSSVNTESIEVEAPIVVKAVNEVEAIESIEEAIVEAEDDKGDGVAAGGALRCTSTHHPQCLDDKTATAGPSSCLVRTTESR